LDSAKELQKIKLLLDYDDLGKEFYETLTKKTPRELKRRA